MTTQLVVESWRHPGGDVLVVTGELDLVTAAQLGDALDRALAGKPAVLVVDLTGVSFLSSAGMTVLTSASNGGRPTRVRIVIGEDSVIRRPLEITGLDAVLPLFPTLDAAFDAPAG